MGLIENIFKKQIDDAVHKALVANHPAWLMATADHERFALPDPSLYHNQAELYQRLAWVNTAVTILAEAAASQQFMVKRKTGETLEDITDHPFERLLRRPNPAQSRTELLIETYSFYKATGNAYWWLNKSGEKSEPAEIWTIPPDRIQPVPDGNMYLKGYTYDPGNGLVIPLEPHEIIHFKRFNPNNRFVGLSPIEAIAVDATADMEMSKSQARLYGSEGGRLPSILAFADPIQDDQWIKMQNEVKDQAAKRQMMMLRNAGKGGVEWLFNALSNSDMQVLEIREFTKEEIYNVLAPGLVSVLSKNSTESNSVTGKETFLEFAVWPLLTAIAEKLTNDLMPYYGEGLIVEPEDPRRTNREMELREIEMFSQTHTVNEIRVEKYGDDPLSDERGELFVSQITTSVKAEPEEQQNKQPEPQEEPGEPEDDEQREDLQRWERKAIKRFKSSGKAVCTFESEFIPASLAGAIEGALEGVKSIDEIKTVFSQIEWVSYP